MNTYIHIANVNGTYRLYVDGKQVVSKAEVAQQNAAAVSAAKRIYTQLHASGKVTDGMTQLQIA